LLNKWDIFRRVAQEIGPYKDVDPKTLQESKKMRDLPWNILFILLTDEFPNAERVYIPGGIQRCWCVRYEARGMELQRMYLLCQHIPKIRRRLYVMNSGTVLVLGPIGDLYRKEV
jgi:hypothetical protein